MCNSMPNLCACTHHGRIMTVIRRSRNWNRFTVAANILLPKRECASLLVRCWWLGEGVFEGGGWVRAVVEQGGDHVSDVNVGGIGGAVVPLRAATGVTQAGVQQSFFLQAPQDASYCPVRAGRVVDPLLNLGNRHPFVGAPQEGHDGGFQWR